MEPADPVDHDDEHEEEDEEGDLDYDEEQRAGDDDCSSTTTTDPESFEKKEVGVLDDDDDDDDEEIYEGSYVEGGLRINQCYVYLLLLVVSVVVITTTYVTLSKRQEQDFEDQYRVFASEVIDLSENSISRVFGDLRGMSTAATAYAETSGNNESWPFVTVSHFERRAQELLLGGRSTHGATKTKLIALAPLVSQSERNEWVSYSVRHQDWIKEGLALQQQQGHANGGHPESGGSNPGSIPEYVYSLDAVQRQYLAPLWQMAPAPLDASIVNLDLLSYPMIDEMVTAILHGGVGVTDINTASPPLISKIGDLRILNYGVTSKEEVPHSYVLQPIFRNFTSAAGGGDDDGSAPPASPSDVVGFVIGVLSWETIFRNILPRGVDGIQVEVSDSCGGSAHTFTVNGPESETVGPGRLHDPSYSRHGIRAELFAFATNYTEDEDDHSPNNGSETSSSSGHNYYCQYALDVYPSDQFRAAYASNEASVYAGIMGGVLAFFFFVYCFCKTDYHYEGGSMHKSVQEYYSSQEEDEQCSEDDDMSGDASENEMVLRAAAAAANAMLPEDGGKGSDDRNNFDGKSMADLFPNVTLMFAGLAGFTAWSSTREPSQVFMLLEIVYDTLDSIARRHAVVKVETIGDCYVAVAGLPEANKDHALIMARFASDCLHKIRGLTPRLEVALGPDTGELEMRIGIHSGPVTAGMLGSGDQSRLQLFGNTMDIAAQMESSGEGHRIQMSQHTADLLIASRKEHLVIPRMERITLKGSGEIQTYWMKVNADSNQDQDDTSRELDDLDIPVHTLEAKQQRLVDWNTALLFKRLTHIIARRQACNSKRDPGFKLQELEQATLQRQHTVLEEVEAVVTLPKYDAQFTVDEQDLDSIEVSETVAGELRAYVQTIGALYRDNPFHNFEHASHVMMSTQKLLSRLLSPTAPGMDDNDDDIHDRTYGIGSDPLVQFALIFAALIHDVDHQGVSNGQLIKEKTRVAAVYKGKSVAEQNSVDIAWELLMDSNFENLRRQIYSTVSEFRRFRSLVVNSVMATDIFDRDLGKLRKERWNTAFSTQCNDETAGNRKATIIMEHLLQASDVSHTMQHWEIYIKYNERLFHEMYNAFLEGRAEKDPSENWFQGEINFFDFYVIPLAMKLEACGVFGVSSYEYLSYAQQNRQEWEAKGRDLVRSMMSHYNQNQTEREEDHHHHAIPVFSFPLASD